MMIRHLDDPPTHRNYGTAHVVKFYMTGIGICEVQVDPDLLIPPRFNVVKFDDDTKLCSISLLDPEYLDGSFHLNEKQKDELIDALSIVERGTFGEFFKLNGAEGTWLYLNDDDDSFDQSTFQRDPNYLRLLPE